MAPRVLEGHQQNVNGVAFLPDGRVVSAGYDATIRIWSLATPAESPEVVTLPTPLNAVAVGLNFNSLIVLGVFALCLGSAGWVFQEELGEVVETVTETFKG